MGCKICGRGACATWMHNQAEQDEYSCLDGWDESKLKAEVVSLRREAESLNNRITEADETVEQYHLRILALEGELKTIVAVVKGSNFGPKG